MKKPTKQNINANGEKTIIVGINTTNQDILNKYATLAYNKDKLTESHNNNINLIVTTIENAQLTA